MKTLFLDVMLNDRFVCTLKYKFCPLFPIELGDLMKFIESKRRNTARRIDQVQCKCTTKALLMRYIVITENPMTGERTTVETKDFESLRIDQSQIVAIVDKSDQQVTYDGETWCSYEKVYNT